MSHVVFTESNNSESFVITSLKFAHIDSVVQVSEIDHTKAQLEKVMIEMRDMKDVAYERRCTQMYVKKCTTNEIFEIDLDAMRKAIV
ncbi:MAG: hypothetical protein ACRDCE_07855 [Cetobacterium sp.]|uniref:hypothetical protein n=1 Tax=Cetobacterium sp. TaxID=2071632 RepID=UPI003EE7E987